MIISEATQNAIVADDYSITSSIIVVVSLVLLELFFSEAQSRWKAFGRVAESLPVVVVEDGRLLEKRAKREGVSLADILAAGREHHGLERLDQFKYAILERHGGISVVPAEGKG